MEPDHRSQLVAALRQAADTLVARRSIDLETTLAQIVTAAVETVHAADLGAPPDSGRWPNFAPRAVALGFRSLLSTELSADGGMRAALNLYSHEPHAYHENARTIAGLFGVQAALLIYGTDQAGHLQHALGTRGVIGQAKGIVVERLDVDDDRAFQMLVKSSQDTNVRLLDAARWLTDPDSRNQSRPPRSPDFG